MAKIGLKHIVYAPITAETTSAVTYGTGKILANAIKADLKVNSTDDKLYGDDALIENVKAFVDGTLALEIDELETTDAGALFGHTVDTATHEMIAKNTDQAVNVGVGFYAVKIKNNVKSYRAIFLHKNVFKEPDELVQTKADRITFGTSTLNSTFCSDKLGEWKSECTFSTEAEAVDYLDEKANVTD